MKKVLLATTAVVAFAGAAAAQDGLNVSGFLEFEAAYGENYDVGGGSSVDDLDFAVDAGLNFDYSQSTKSGLEYGMHFELDMYQSDTLAPRFQIDNAAACGGVNCWFGPAGTAWYGDRLQGDNVQFNDGYVFINSALGNVSMGDTGTAGKAANQLNVPFLVNAREYASYTSDGSNAANLELEQVRYQNSFLGVDFDASVDDDANWALGIGYGADVGGVTIGLGLSAGEEALAGSVNAAVGGLSFGVNYAMEEVAATTEYVAAGVSYTMGALSVGTGVETEIRHGALSGKETESNYFVGASYEIADGLTLRAGAANLDSDSASNWSAMDANFGVNQAGYYNGAGKDLADNEGRAWTAGASVIVNF